MNNLNDSLFLNKTSLFNNVSFLSFSFFERWAKSDEKKAPVMNTGDGVKRQEAVFTKLWPSLISFVATFIVNLFTIRGAP